MNENVKRITEANRSAWNMAMPYHQAAHGKELDELFSVPGYIYQEEEDLLKIFRQIEITGKDVIHLCCNNGLELMSLKNMGAARCYGVDISDAAIADGKQRAKKCGIDVSFLRANIYELPPELDHSFDLVHVTIGGLGWLPDVALFFKTAARLLRSGGRVLLFEMHPFGEMLPFDGDDHKNSLEIVEPYFRSEPIYGTDSLDYLGGNAYESSGHYWTVHTLSQIVMGASRAGFAIEHFEEYPYDMSCCHERQAELAAGIPLSYLLMGRIP